MGERSKGNKNIFLNRITFAWEELAFGIFVSFFFFPVGSNILTFRNPEFVSCILMK